MERSARTHARPLWDGQHAESQRASVRACCVLRCILRCMQPGGHGGHGEKSPERTIPSHFAWVSGRGALEAPRIASEPTPCHARPGQALARCHGATWEGPRVVVRAHARARQGPSRHANHDQQFSWGTPRYLGLAAALYETPPTHQHRAPFHDTVQYVPEHACTATPRWTVISSEASSSHRGGGSLRHRAVSTANISEVMSIRPLHA